jgi:hypothetical protein
LENIHEKHKAKHVVYEGEDLDVEVNILLLLLTKAIPLCLLRG